MVDVALEREPRSEGEGAATLRLQGLRRLLRRLNIGEQSPQAYSCV